MQILIMVDCMFTLLCLSFAKEKKWVFYGLIYFIDHDALLLSHGLLLEYNTSPLSLRIFVLNIGESYEIY